MAKYKVGGLSLNGGEDKASKKPGMLKGAINFEFEESLDSLSLDGIFQTNPVMAKKKDNSKKVKEVSFKKGKKKGNELI